MGWMFKGKNLFRRGLARDIDEELRGHLDMRREELMAEGMSAADAEAEARRRFGNVTLAHEQAREAHVFTRIESVVRDLRYGARVLRRQPVFTLTAALTLALVIGATGAIFSLLDAVLLRAWPVEHPEQLVMVVAKDHQGHRMPLSMGDLADYRASTALSSLAGGIAQSVNLTGVEEPTRLIGSFVTADFFPLLGVRPLRGRMFQAQDDRPGAARVCLLNEDVWKGRFGGAPDILGRALTLNGELYTVVGIVPATFKQPIVPGEVWLPMQDYPNYSPGRSQPDALGIGRRAPGVSVAQARAALEGIAGQLARAYPDTDKGKGVEVTDLRERLVQDVRPTLLLVGGAVGCILLIACANIAGLLLAKASGRWHEMAVRASLGASTGRIARQLLTESLLLAALGGVMGLGVAYAGAQILPATVGGLSDFAVAPNSTLILIVTALTVGTGLLFGMAPALLTRHMNDALRVRTAAGRHARMRSVLVGAQVAVAMVLLAGAGLTIRSLMRLTGVEPGFSTNRILTLEYRLPRTKYPSGEQITAFHNRVVERVAALPGVEAAGIVGGLPFSGNSNLTQIVLPDRAAPPAGMPYIAEVNFATPTYFNTVHIPLLAGRVFEARDTASTARVVVVSRTFAERYWPGRSAIGEHVTVPDLKATATVVGVVGDVKQDDLDEEVQPQLYAPYAQNPFIFATLVVRTHGDPMAMARTVEKAVWSIDRDQPMWKIRTLESLVDRTTKGGRRGMLIWTLTSFAAFAVLLAAIGIYGVLAYTVGQRTAEFGIRMALGASPRDVLGVVLRKGFALAGAGLAIGFVISLGVSRFLRGELYQVSTTDPEVYLGISIVILAVAALAIAAPARRAMRIDPGVALRHD